MSTDPRREFYIEARAAIKAGLLTPAEMVAIARPGTRKAGYWARHLVDLQAVLKERQVMRLERERADAMSADIPGALARRT